MIEINDLLLFLSLIGLNEEKMLISFKLGTLVSEEGVNKSPAQQVASCGGSRPNMRLIS